IRHSVIPSTFGIRISSLYQFVFIRGKQMKSLGVIGGLGPESTIDYYERIIALYRERTRDGSYPRFFIISVDLKKGLDFMEAVELLGPETKGKDYIDDKYMNELVPGKLLPETRAGLLAIVDRMKAKSDIDGVVLAGTELPLILRDPDHNGTLFLNTTKIHVEAAVTEMLS